MLTIDFETEGITVNPVFKAPKPVGVSIKYGNQPSKYYAFGHPTENNSTFSEARQVLLNALDRAEQDSEGWLAHNAPFECSVLRDHFDWRPKQPKKIHDTQYLLFLTDPYAFTFSLKPSAERVLGLPPDEQDDVRDWLLQHQPLKGAGIVISPSKTNEHFWARYICLAPGDLVGEYAKGDTDRTFMLFEKLHPEVVELGMLPAYQREQLLMPILSASSERGVRLDMETLDRDIKKYRKAQKKSDDYIFKRLGEFDMSKDAQLANALEAADQITEWVLTPTGKRSTARKNLVGRVKDPQILSHLSYRNVLETCLGTFALPWMKQAEEEGGRVHPQWNQVKGDRGADGDMSGTKTGRMSCRKPNLQNPPNDFEEIIIPKGQPEMMHMRKYLLPEPYTTWLKRDFSAQEMRIMAHFAEGRLFDEFHKNPRTDPHDAVRAIILEHAGIELPRKHVKITGFGIMYGRGVASTAAALGIPDYQAKEVRDAYFSALPEIKDLSAGTRRAGRMNEPLRTWGGRVYYREPNPERDLSYKLLNYLIQGSAADQTKQSAIDWENIRRPEDTLLAMVHDEFNICAPIGEESDAMYRLQQAMDSPRFDVPFASEGYMGSNWSELEKYDDK